MKFELFFPIFDQKGVPILLGLFLALYGLEMYYQLREQRQDKLMRSWQNLALSAVSMSVARWALIPALVWIAAAGEKWQFGALNELELPYEWRFVFGFVLLDYGNYFWHVLTHRVPFLWRFHLVHHTDLDLDVTTGTRFHFAELFFSIFFRGAVVAIIGCPPVLILFYALVFEACTAFHHSNLKLPIQLERVLSKAIVTPRMHGIHHSIVRQEMDSNFSVIFNLWDRIHGTIRLNVPQKDITVGLPAYRDESEQTIINLLKLPFQEQRPWRLPDGSIPYRELWDTEGQKDKLAE